jgi:hypothetical protein
MMPNTSLYRKHKLNVAIPAATVVCGKMVEGVVAEGSAVRK